MKKRLAVLFAVLTVLTSVVLPCGMNAVAANYFPTTPIEFENLNLALFSQLDLTTGTNNFNQNDNWKYYYRCSFTPQYSAAYTVTVSSRKKMKTELYDAAGSLVSASYAPEELNAENRYVFSNTAYLEKGKTYFYEFSYTSGYFNSCGPFSVWMTSTAAEEIPQDDYLHLYVNGEKQGAVYELSSFSPQQLLQDLSMKVVYANGKLYEWKGSESLIPYLNGCDIILDLSDCAAELGVHTVTAHYMGREVTAQFEIVNCIHRYETESVTAPTWLEPGYTVYRCSKCSGSVTGDFTNTVAQSSGDFFDLYNTCETDENYQAENDLNHDGYINARDYSMMLKMYQQAEKAMLSAYNAKRGDSDYVSVLDMNADGYINARDISMLSRTMPQPDSNS